MQRRSVKLFIYCVQAVLSTSISGLSVAMFGDGTIDWPHFRFMWCLFIIGVCTSVFNVLRAALDQETSSTNPPTAVVPVTVNAVAQVPVISSILAAVYAIGTDFNYQITATNTPASFNATGLPTGLVIDTATGIISGRPTEKGVFNITISAINAAGTGSANLILTV